MIGSRIENSSFVNPYDDDDDDGTWIGARLGFMVQRRKIVNEARTDSFDIRIYRYIKCLLYYKSVYNNNNGEMREIDMILLRLNGVIGLH